MWRSNAIAIIIIFLSAGTGMAQDTSSQIEARASVWSPKNFDKEYIYRITINNISKSNVCVLASSFPSPSEYRAIGIDVVAPYGEVEGVDIGEISESERIRYRNSIIVLFPNKSISGYFSLNDLILIDKYGFYEISHPIHYINCSLIANIDDLSPYSSFWEKHGKMLRVKSRFLNK